MSASRKSEYLMFVECVDPQQNLGFFTEYGVVAEGLEQAKASLVSQLAAEGVYIIDYDSIEVIDENTHKPVAVTSLMGRSYFDSE